MSSTVNIFKLAASLISNKMMRKFNKKIERAKYGCIRKNSSLPPNRAIKDKPLLLLQL